MEILQEERSEQTDIEKGGNMKPKLYPDLTDLEDSESTDSEEELQALIEQIERTKIRRKEKKREKERPENEDCCRASLCREMPTAPPPYV